MLVSVNGKMVCTAVGDVASFQPDHSEVVDGDTRRSVPVGKRYATAVVLGIPDVGSGQRCRYRIVVDVHPLDAVASAGRFRHCSMVCVTSWIRHTFSLRV